MSGHHLAEHVFGHKRGATHVVDAQLHVGALVVGIVQARDDMRHVEQSACHLGAHEVRVVELRDGGHNVAVLHAGLHKRLLVEADALHRGAVEVAPQVGERIGVAVDHAHVAAVVETACSPAGSRRDRSPRRSHCSYRSFRQAHACAVSVQRIGYCNRSAHARTMRENRCFT